MLNQTVKIKPWWLEPEAMILAVLVVVAYFTRAGVLPLRGEEPTRAQMAFEMSYGNDWLVPRQQGEPFLIRPPLQHWAIAASCLALGDWGPWSVRFPSMLATLLTTLLIYGYSRNFLSRVGALTAGAAFASMPEMFQMGRQAETEGIFILFVSASLLLWHWGILRKWPRWVTFSLGYAVMALAMLTKGIQAPVYFTGSIVVYLGICGEFALLFSGAHVIGLLVGASVICLWIIPYAHVVGWSNMPQVWFGDPAVTYSGQLEHWGIGRTLTHLVEYPAVIFAGMMPWSLLLIPYLRREMRRFVRDRAAPLGFVATTVAVAFPTCWLPVGGLPRYFAPLYPCVAILIGASMQWIVESKDSPAVRIGWRRSMRTMGTLVVALAVVIAGVSVIGSHIELLSPLAESMPAAMAFALGCGIAAFLIFRGSRRIDEAAARTVVLSIAATMAIAFVGWGTNIRSRRSENIELAMQDLKRRLPPTQQLYSLEGHTVSLFAYYYGLPMIKPSPHAMSHLGTSGELLYFCFTSQKNVDPKLPFAWEEVGRVSMDRNHHDIPDRAVVVGRQLSPAFSLAPPTRPASE